MKRLTVEELIKLCIDGPARPDYKVIVKVHLCGHEVGWFISGVQVDHKQNHLILKVPTR